MGGTYSAIQRSEIHRDTGPMSERSMKSSKAPEIFPVGTLRRRCEMRGDACQNSN